jgi:hypothetical protein
MSAVEVLFQVVSFSVESTFWAVSCLSLFPG